MTFLIIWRTSRVEEIYIWTSCSFSRSEKYSCWPCLYSCFCSLIGYKLFTHFLFKTVISSFILICINFCKDLYANPLYLDWFCYWNLALFNLSNSIHFLSAQILNANQVAIHADISTCYDNITLGQARLVF